MPPKNAGARGVSAEEKRQRMLEIFKSAEVYNMKELEKLGSKQGVHAQVVGDVIQGLVDDGLVDSDKIGGGNFYWALPSKQGQRKRMRLEALRANISAAQSTIEKENALISKLEAERVDSERATNLKRLSSLKEKERDLNVKLKHYEDRDPTVLKKLGEKIEEAMEHATRWGSNLATIRDYVQDEVNYDVERFDARFELSAMDLDPITWTNYKQYFPSTESAVRKAQDDEFPPECSPESDTEEPREPSSDSTQASCVPKAAGKLRSPASSTASSKMSPAVSSKSGCPASKKAIKGAGNKAGTPGSKEASSEPTTVANNKHVKKTTDKKAARSKGAMNKETPIGKPAAKKVGTQKEESERFAAEDDDFAAPPPKKKLKPPMKAVAKRDDGCPEEEEANSEAQTRKGCRKEHSDLPQKETPATLKKAGRKKAVAR